MVQTMPVVQFLPLCVDGVVIGVSDMNQYDPFVLIMSLSKLNSPTS